MIERATGRLERKTSDFFSYVSKEETRYLLESFGYGANKMLLDAIYFDGSNGIGVGVLEASEERCRGHNRVLPGIYMIEAAAQTGLVLDKLMFKNQNKVPLFKGVKDFSFFSPAPQDSIINIYIDKSQDVKNDNNVISLAEIYLGEKLISKGQIEGTVVDKEFFNKYLERESKKVKNIIPKFSVIY